MLMRQQPVTAIGTFIALILTLAVSLPLAASNPADTYGYSPRGIALGNAMTATVNDWSSVWYNPAGLGKTRSLSKSSDGKEVDLALKKKKGEKSSNNSSNYHPTEFALSSFYTVSGHSISGLTGDQTTEALNGTSFGMVTVGMALDLNMIVGMPSFISSARLGIGATVGIDGTAMKINDIDPRTPDYVRYGRDAQRAVILAGLGLGFLDDMFGAGVSVFTSFGGTGHMDLNGAEISPDPQTPLAQTKMDMKMVPSFNAGLYFTPDRLLSLLKGLQIGVSYRMESKVEIAPLDAEATTTVFSMLLDMKNMAIYDYYVPHIITAGISYSIPVPLVEVIVSVDFEYQLWSKFSISKSNTQVLEDRGVFLPGMKDVPIVRTGIEVKPLSWLSIMTGYYYQPSMLKSLPIDSTINFMDNDMHAISLGAEFVIPPLLSLKGPLVIAAGYQLQYFADTTVTRTVFNQTTELDEIRNYSYGGMNHLVTVSVGIKI